MKKIVSLALALMLVFALSTAAMAENTVVKIGATPNPHAEILEFVKPLLEEKGVDLDIIVYNDYVTPNKALSDGSIDANYFQHLAYMNSYNESVADAEKLDPAIGVHYEPYALYAGKVTSLDDLKDSDVIAVPNDPSNEARALVLLQDAGLITLAEGVGIEATVYDIVSKSVNVEILEIEAAQAPRTLPDIAMAVINGNYAIQAGLKMTDALFVEKASGDVGATYTNYVAVRVDNKDAEWVNILREVLCSKEVADFINNNESYAGGVIPVFDAE